jgi:hypothetical protein
MGTACPKFMKSVWIVFLFLSINFIIAPIVFSPPGGADNGGKTASSKRDAAARRDALFDSRFSSCRAGNLFGIKDSCI